MPILVLGTSSAKCSGSGLDEGTNKNDLPGVSGSVIFRLKKIHNE